MDFITETIKQFLNIYWLRPEVAIWRTFDVVELKKIRFVKPIMDLGCGDGTFTFTNLGGRVSHDFDVFNTMKNTSGFFQKKDIHNQFSDFTPNIIKKPKNTVDVGVDLKINLLKKAEKLKTYEKLIRHDLNKPLPFLDGQFKTIFSNVFYWIENIEHLLKETKRILKSDGILVILVPDTSFKKKLILNEFLNNKAQWAKILDRGIYHNISNHCYDYEKWESIFKNVGLTITYHSSYLPERFIDFWNIGLRPYSPFLIEMANKLKKEDRTKIKNRVIREITPILKSYIEYELENKKNKQCFHLFMLKSKY